MSYMNGNAREVELALVYMQRKAESQGEHGAGDRAMIESAMSALNLMSGQIERQQHWIDEFQGALGRANTRILVLTSAVRNWLGPMINVLEERLTPLVDQASPQKESLDSADHYQFVVDTLAKDATDVAVTYLEYVWAMDRLGDRSNPVEVDKAGVDKALNIVKRAEQQLKASGRRTSKNIVVTT